MKVLISGSTGLVGRATRSLLDGAGHEAVALRRGPPQGRTPRWDIDEGVVELGGARFDAVVHLAGESIADGRWTEAKKERIRRSRCEGTRLLAEHLARLPEPPGALVCASAIGYYGDRGEEELFEHSPPGEGFLPEVCREWEAAADPAREAGIRTVHLRIGIVLAREGGALAKMLTPFKLGVGGRLGSGQQWMSWISRHDLAAVVLHALEDERLEGPVNAVAPESVTNRTFTKTLGHVLSRPTVLPLPAVGAQLALGEMADELLLASTRVRPKVLEERGFQFRHARLEEALRWAVQDEEPGRTAAGAPSGDDVRRTA